MQVPSAKELARNMAGARRTAAVFEFTTRLQLRISTITDRVASYTDIGEQF